MIGYIRQAIAREYWNVNQRVWGGADATWGDQREGQPWDPGIPGIRWSPSYEEGPGIPEDVDPYPNFAFDGVEVCWYKSFGRSMTVNHAQSPTEWVAWFDRCLDVVALFGQRMWELSAEDATEPENAPSRCAVCGRAFSWPASRCPYDGIALAAVFP